MTAITPEAFMAQPSDPDEDRETPSDGWTPPGAWPLIDPIESIAVSLRTIANSLEPGDRCDEVHDDLADLQREYAELEALHDAKQALIDQVLETCKPSTSKLANSIRAVLEPVVVPAGNAAEMGHPVPPDDADVEAWRAYARSLGYTGPDVDQANRSQIRTMLGIEQPVAEGAQS